VDSTRLILNVNCQAKRCACRVCLGWLVNTDTTSTLVLMSIDLDFWPWALSWHTGYSCPCWNVCVDFGFSAPFRFRVNSTGQTDGSTSKTRYAAYSDGRIKMFKTCFNVLSSRSDCVCYVAKCLQDLFGACCKFNKFKHILYCLVRIILRRHFTNL